MNPFLRWLGQHEGLGWAGLIVGVAGILAVPGVGLESMAGAALLGTGSIFIGGVLGSWIVVRRRRHAVECLESVQAYEMHDARGKSCRNVTTDTFRARNDLTSFVHSRTIASGQMHHVASLLRTLGHDLKKGQMTVRPFQLSAHHLHEVKELNSGVTVMVVPPAPVRKGEHLEIVRTFDCANCFASDDEYIEKEVLYPIKDLKFHVVFQNGLKVTNCAGTKYQGGVPVEEGFTTVEPTAHGNDIHLNWNVGAAEPGESYRISWRWL